jgi:hypothetical protein
VRIPAVLHRFARSHCSDVQRGLLLVRIVEVYEESACRLELRELFEEEVHLSEAATKRVSAGEKSGRWGSLGRRSRSRTASGTVHVDLDVFCGCQCVTEKMSRLRTR